MKFLSVFLLLILSSASAFIESFILYRKAGGKQRPSRVMKLTQEASGFHSESTVVVFLKFNPNWFFFQLKNKGGEIFHLLSPSNKSYPIESKGRK